MFLNKQGQLTQFLATLSKWQKYKVKSYIDLLGVHTYQRNLFASHMYILTREIYLPVTCTYLPEKSICQSHVHTYQRNLFSSHIYILTSHMYILTREIYLPVTYTYLPEKSIYQSHVHTYQRNLFTSHIYILTREIYLPVTCTLTREIYLPVTCTYLPEKSICQSHPSFGRYISLKMSHVKVDGPEGSKQTVIFTLTTYFFSFTRSLIEYLCKKKNKMLYFI